MQDVDLGSPVNNQNPGFNHDSSSAPMNPEQANVNLNQEKPLQESQAVQPIASLNEQLVSDQFQTPATESPPSHQTDSSAVKPSSSQVESASAPKTVVPTIQPTRVSGPKKMSPEKKAPGKRRFILGCGGLFLGLFIVFILLLVLVLSQAGESNSVLQTLQIDAAGLRTFLSGIVAVSFGFMAVLFLVLTVIGLFRFIGAKKEDGAARTNGLRMMLFGLIPFVLVVFIWFALVSFISGLNIDVERVRAEILVLDPPDLANLSAPVEVTFSALSVATSLASNGLNVEQMDWDLNGDGNFGTPVSPTQPQVTRRYTRRGNYNVGLRAKISGEEDFRIYTVRIPILEATFSALPDTGTAPQEIRFDASDILPDGRQVDNLSWDFDGDGIYDIEGVNELTPRHTFTEIGNYRVHLRLIDDSDNVENYYREIEILPSSEPILSALIQAEPGLSGDLPLAIQFDGDGSRSLKGTIVNYRWNFGDGSAEQVGKTVSHVFDTAGIFQVTLTVMDDEGRTADRTVEVEVSASASSPEAVISTSPRPTTDPETNEITLTGQAPFQVSFDASDSTDPDEDIVDYKWDFDEDGTMDEEGASVEYTFSEPGIYLVSLTVVDAQGQEGQTMLMVEVQNPGVLAMIEAKPVEGVAPLVVQFDATSSSAFGGQIVSYDWDFDDNTAPITTGALVTHRFDQVGQYIVTLSVLTNNNERATTTQQIFVRQVSLQACFDPSRDSGPAPLSISFNPQCTTGDAQTFDWNFGDGDTSDARTPVHEFETPGTYTVTLQVSDGQNNVSTYQEEIIVE